ncbi:MAG TPA: 2-polyprenylphenol 6-hydroxylase [Alphaproteobacteria bacterium]|nr:2-polyprenylphenol 6-hydroxylase [Alphaproteobacteria bacterium]HJP21977.1 2-polyprenylphenol 6-hydroxylase [Alphaproteobacteria bacterium]
MIRALRNLGRVIRIGRTLARHDALFPLDAAGLPPLLVRGVKLLAGPPGRQAQALRPGQRLAAALQELGPSFIKFGQSLSTRPDVAGEGVAADLGELRDRLPPFAAGEARRTVEQEFDRPLEEMFARFEDQPVAAASIAQVHMAETADGAAVAVKVLRPGIEQAFQRDLDLFYWLAEMVETFQPDFRRLRPLEVVRTFNETVDIEMDLRLEAAAASELAENFEGDESFRVPEVDWQRTERRVLTLERIEGIPIDDNAALEAAGHDLDAVAAKVLLAFLKQAFRDGFFHADLHQGNLFVDPEGNIIAVDFGIMGRLDRQTRRYVAEVLLAFLTGNYRRAAEVHFEAGYVPQHKSLDVFTQACRSIGEPIQGRPLNEISIARLLAQLFRITETFAMQTQPQLLLLQKTMVVAEGVCRNLGPGANFWQIAKPFLADWVKENLGPEAAVRDTMGEAAATMRQIPGLMEKAQLAVGALTPQGVRLHPDSERAIAHEAARRRGLWPMLLFAVAVGLVLLLAAKI